MDIENPGERWSAPGAVANLSEQVDMTKPIRACLACGKPVVRPGQSQVNRKFCGDECRDLYRRENTPDCAFEGCSKRAKTGGLCSGHAEQKRKGRELQPLKHMPGYKNGIRCAFEGCTKYARSNGLCWGHAEQKSRGLPLTALRPRRPTNIHARRDKHGRKHCAGCDQWLDESRFYRVTAKGDGLHYRCRDCSHARHVEREFNLPEGWYARQFEAQGGACAICRIPAARLVKKLVVDHDHACCPEASRSCGKCVRALLCGQCNIALGALKDRVDLFLIAVRYLEGHRERRVVQLPAA